MDLTDLRAEIDNIDSEILDLFIKRMDVCRQVGEYKKVNKLPVMQGNREQEIIDRIKNSSPNGLEDGAALLFRNIMDISKSLQNIEIAEAAPKKKYAGFIPEKARKIACQGTSGSYSEHACKKLFGDKSVEFYHDFEDVLQRLKTATLTMAYCPLKIQR